VSWIDHIVEKQIADAITRGELVPPHLHGAPLDLDTQRGDGWWAEQFVRKERSRLLHEESLPARAGYLPRFWRSATVGELTGLIAEANRWITTVNAQMLPADGLELFDPREVIDTWRSLRPA
jgi:hypothetical protein